MECQAQESFGEQAKLAQEYLTSLSMHYETKPVTPLHAEGNFFVVILCGV